MALFDIFEKKEDLLAAVEAAIVDTDGKFSLGEMIQLKRDFDKKSEDHRKGIVEKDTLRKEKAELEKLKKEFEDKIELLEKRIPTEEVEKQLLELKKQVRDVDTLKANNTELLGKIEEFKTKERNTTIHNAIVGALTAAKVRPEVIEDSRLYVQEFQIDDSGDVVTKEGVRVNDYFSQKVKKNPHWLPQSQGGGSATPTNKTQESGFDAKVKSFVEKGDTMSILKAGLEQSS